MKKISINVNKSKFAFYKTVKLLSLIIAGIGAIALFIPFSEVIWKWLPFKNLVIKFLLELLMVLAIYLLLGTIIFLIFCFLNKVTIKKNKLKITICKGDILDNDFLTKNDVLVFAGDIDNTIKFDETSKISKLTIHGQFLDKFGETITLKDEGFLKEINYCNSKGKKLKAFLVPLTTILPPKYRAVVRKDLDFLQICKETIEYIDGSNCQKILLPIIGSGDTSRMKPNYLEDKTHLISLWITLFQIYCNNKNLFLTFVVNENDWSNIRFKELR